MTGTYIAVIAFVIAMLYLGYVGMRKTKNMTDFFLAGRNLGPWLSAFSYGTTYFSAVIFVGFAGNLGWKFGMNVLWISLGNIVLGTTLAWIVLARRTRSMTARLNVMTMPEFIEARYKSPLLKPLAAIIIFIFLIPYSASVYQGLSILFQQNLNLSFDFALYFMAVLTGIYLIMGGYHSINIADMIQGTIMIVGALLMVFFFINAVGGLTEANRIQRERFALHQPKPPAAVQQSPAASTAVDKAKEIAKPATPAKPPVPGWVMLLSLVVLTSLGPWGLPQMVQKYYAIKDKSIIPKAIIVTTIFSLIIAFVAYYCGSLTHIFFSPGKSETIQTVKGSIDTIVLPMKGTPPALNVDALIPMMLQNFTPRWLTTAVLLLILSASMSTLSGLVLVSSSAIAIDLYQGRGADESRKKSALVFMRILCAVFVIASVIIAKNQIAVIVDLMSVAWGVVAGCFLAPYLYGLFWKRGTAAAVWVSMILALLINIVGYKIYGKPMTPVMGSLAMVAPLIIFPIVSLLTPPLPKGHVDFTFEKSE